MLIFVGQLLTLLGTPQTGSLSLRLSALGRIRSADLLLRASSTLGSLGRLYISLPSTSIPRTVADGAALSLHHIKQACTKLSTHAGPLQAVIAEDEAEQASFKKSMVGQLYFPDEHKTAVYLPLLGPVGVALVMGLKMELKRWRQKQKTSKAQEEAEKKKANRQTRRRYR